MKKHSFCLDDSRRVFFFFLSRSFFREATEEHDIDNLRRVEVKASSDELGLRESKEGDKERERRALVDVPTSLQLPDASSSSDGCTVLRWHLRPEMVEMGCLVDQKNLHVELWASMGGWEGRCCSGGDRAWVGI